MALCTGFPVARSHTTAVSRWLVMPMPARSLASSLALASAPRHTSTVARQISSGSCPSQPGLGKICGSSFCAEATGRRATSNTMARVLVVPWSMARMCLPAILRPRLVRPVDGEVHRLQESGLQRGVAEQAERITRHRAIMAGAFEGVGNGVMAVDQHLRPFEIAVVLVEILDGALPEFAVYGTAAQEGEDHRQGDLALAKIVAYGLAELGLAAGIVERVVDQLEGDAEIHAEALERHTLRPVMA